ncbi:sushi, von Willebrand factor type A, EGF and pentraxin domain-containing protein 1-like [Mercenaria mercenaria]|uniref:sushi, von Willebrand factor type A, EGF and pentraxin domain-containing protein 1-like n=1 Tax=Mercenaria mercenaria TaxID=6596 RepID=UPI00234E4BDE|nr:sushi, von Willebrand factor type A, EGF and pentraxin domain-containing protein 1-like [Mercenaria mercenaria]
MVQQLCPLHVRFSINGISITIPHLSPKRSDGDSCSKDSLIFLLFVTCSTVSLYLVMLMTLFFFLCKAFKRSHIVLDCQEVRDIGINHAGNIRVHNDTKYNSTADIDCDEGYYNIKDTQTAGISTTTISCSQHGTWVNIPTCVKKDCGKLDQLNISNVKVMLTFTDARYQANAAMTCDTGYTDKHKPQAMDFSTVLIKCSANGTWEHLPECVRKDCGNVHNISIDNADNRRLHTDTKYSSTADIDCDEGYYNIKDTQTAGISTTTISCSQHGTWVNMPTCRRKECGDLSKLNIPNAQDRLIIYDTKYNSIANISCDPGYKEQNKSQTKGITSTLIRCNENGTWANQPTCVRKDCGDVYNISISNAVNRRLHDDTKYSSTADIDCDEGYYDINDTQTTEISTTAITCSEYGTWINMPMCVRKDCGNLTSPEHGNVTLNNGLTTFNSTATFTCDTGYELTDKNISICNASDCRTPSAPINGKVDTTSGTIYQSVATFSCDTGYTLNGGNNTVYCGILTAPGNGTVDFSNGTTYTSIAYYRCNIGFDLNGTNKTSCQANRTWDAQTPTCVIRESEMMSLTSITVLTSVQALRIDFREVRPAGPASSPP